jgi:hypothetical protein
MLLKRGQLLRRRDQDGGRHQKAVYRNWFVT